MSQNFSLYENANSNALHSVWQTFDVDVKAVDGWGIDPFTRRSILDALPKDPALEEAPIMSRAKAVGDFVSQKLLPALNERVSCHVLLPCVS